MMKKEKTVTILIYLLGAICLCAFVAIRFEPLFNSTLKEPVVENYWDKTRYGELYYFSMIRHFREKGIPPAQRKFQFSEKQASVKDADILTFGDSYFDFSRHKQIPECIADSFNRKVHFVFNDFPLDYLEENKYRDTLPKLVLFERVERYIPVTFQEKHIYHEQKPEESSKIRKACFYILDKIFYRRSEELYDAMLKRSYLTTFFYSVNATIKFDLFGYISNLTPVYKKDRDNSWLFYYDQVNGKRTSFYYDFSQDQMDSICNNMAELVQTLKQNYNMDLVYIPLPARYTLYHTVLNQDAYNNFLPRLYEGLDSKV